MQHSFLEGLDVDHLVLVSYWDLDKTIDYMLPLQQYKSHGVRG